MEQNENIESATDKTLPTPTGQKPRPRGDGFSEERKRLVLVALRRGERVLGACAVVGVSNRSAYNHRDRDPAFARDWDLARAMTVAPTELIAFERAAIGVAEPVHAYGRLVHTRVRRSDALLRTLLAAEKPRKFGRRAGLAAERAAIERMVDAKVTAAIEPLVDLLAMNFVNPRRGGDDGRRELAPRGEAGVGVPSAGCKVRSRLPKTFPDWPPA